MKPYVLDDVLRTLNEVAPYDWRGFFEERIDRIAPDSLMSAIESTGWKLTFSAEPNVRLERITQDGRIIEVDTVGFYANSDGTVADVVPRSSAWRAGLSPDMKILSVNGRTYTPELLHDAIKGSPRYPDFADGGELRPAPLGHVRLSGGATLPAPRARPFEAGRARGDHAPAREVAASPPLPLQGAAPVESTRSGPRG